MIQFVRHFFIANALDDEYTHRKTYGNKSTLMVASQQAEAPPVDDPTSVLLFDELSSQAISFLFVF